MNIVIDSSIALSWYFEDEANPYAEEVLNSVTIHGALVPFHWKAEVANGLLMGVRRRRISLEYRDRVLIELDSIGITHDFTGHQHVWPSASAIAGEHGLTIYDAIYIELARRRGYLLTTLDKKLGLAAQAVGVYLTGITQ